jgi:hypothetical protein
MFENKNLYENLFHREVLIEKWTPPTYCKEDKWEGICQQVWFSKSDTGQEKHRNNNLPAIINVGIDVWWKHGVVVKLRLKDWDDLDRFENYKQTEHQCTFVYP